MDAKAIKILAGVGVPIACFLHGYAGFIFGSVKANALWMTPLMPVIFIMSAIVSGVALCLLIYIITMEIKKYIASRKSSPASVNSLNEIKGVETDTMRTTVKYLTFFMVFSISLELLDLVFRGYTAVKSWDILRSVIYGKDFINIFLFQYVLGNLVPFHPPSSPRHDRQTSDPVFAAGSLWGLHDEMERRDRRTVFFPDFFRVYGLPSAHHPLQP